MRIFLIFLIFFLFFKFLLKKLTSKISLPCWSALSKLVPLPWNCVFSILFTFFKISFFVKVSSPTTSCTYVFHIIKNTVTRSPIIKRFIMKISIMRSSIMRSAIMKSFIMKNPIMKSPNSHNYRKRTI